MLDLLKLRIRHGVQTIADIRNAALMETHRGFPIIDEPKYKNNWQTVIAICPTNAITKNPAAIDLGKCIFCGACERVSNGAIRFTKNYKVAASKKDHLVVASGTVYAEYSASAIEAQKKIHTMFGRSLKLRQVSAGGCNGCEMELSACGNVNFDMGVSVSISSLHRAMLTVLSSPGRSQKIWHRLCRMLTKVLASRKLLSPSVRVQSAAASLQIRTN